MKYLLLLFCFILFLSGICFSQEQNIDQPLNLDKKTVDTQITEPKEEINSNKEAVDSFELPSFGTSVKQSIAKKIFQKMSSANIGLNDYECPLKASIKAKYSFLEVPFNLDGNYYFKAPDRYHVKFERAPQFLSKYPQVFGWSLPNPSEYTIKILNGEAEYANCFILRLIPIIGRGDLQKIEMWVDKKTYLFPRQLYSYREGGFVDVKANYRKIENYSLFDLMQMEISFPKSGIKANAIVNYGEYKINQGLDDSLFTK